MRNIVLTMALLGSCFTQKSLALTELSDNELGEVSGQASLVNIDKYNYATNNFYQIKLNSTIETSINIDQLDLRDQNGDSQIKINNLSMNGGDLNGVSSMKLENPFVEFAFEGAMDDANARSREIIGVRLGADNIDGYMSFGNRGAVSGAQNDSAVNGGGAIAGNSGIELFHGYMKTAPIRGTFTTRDSAGNISFTTPSRNNDNNGRSGSPAPFVIGGLACVDLGFFGCAPTLPFEVEDARMFFKSLIVDDNVTNNTLDGARVILGAGHIVNTTSGPVSSTIITTDPVPAPRLDDVHVTGTADADMGLFTIPINMDATAALTGINVVATLDQELRYIHRVRITPNGGGFSLSAQNRDLQWRGDPVMAREGWWMSINDDVDMGDLATVVTLPDSTLINIANQATQYLENTSNPGVPVAVSATDIFGTADPNIGNVPIPGLVPVSLGSQDLGANQNEIRNCWNGNLGC